jgi:hypothetical protein
MLKGLVLAPVIGGVALVVAAATGSVDDLRSQLPDIRAPFNEVTAALEDAHDGERRWDKVVKDANSICARDPRGRFVVSPVPPPDGGQYVRAIRIELGREREIQAELAALQPPPNYEPPYALFLHRRRDALAALERLQEATKARNQEDYVDAAGVLHRKTGFTDLYARTVGMPACVFGSGV